MSSLEARIQSERMLRPASSLFRERAFTMLWLSTIFSGLALNMFYFAEAWYVVNVLNMEASLGVIYLIGTLPRVLFMAIGGVLADRISPSKIMFVSTITKSALLAVLVMVLVEGGGIGLGALTAFALLFGILDAFFWPASGSIVPSIVSKDGLTRANSIIQTTNQSTSIFGPMISGFVIVALRYEGIFGLITVLLALGALFALLVRVRKSPSPDTKADRIPMLTSVKEGIGYVRQAPVLKAFVLKTLFLNLFFTGPFAIGIPVFVKHVLHGETLDFSMLQSFLAGGMLVSSIVLGILNLKRRRGLISVLAQLGLSFSFLALSMAVTLWTGAVFAACMGISMGISNICAISVIQNHADKAYIGRVMSIQTMSSMGLTPISYGLTSLLLSVGVEIQHIVMGGALLLLAFTFWLIVKIPSLRKAD
ncbi:MFS transporter [Paenibacillus chitinolyticus]|uniref:MFS transporter n=1 Tax=Paenibacillus chitinolyticus TaxID=79263 RepID=UPI003CFCD615